jgi:hypothetical protein
VQLLALSPPQSKSIVPTTLPPVLHIQLDNACSDNKNKYTFCFFSLLVANGVFREVYVNSMLVGHTHEDIDALFGRWSMKLRKHDYPTVPLLMKSFMDGESIPAIPHLIEEVPDFKGFIDTFICKKGEALQRHTAAQAFKFYKIRTVGLLCNTSSIAQIQSGCLRKVEEYVFGEKTMKGSLFYPLGSQELWHHSKCGTTLTLQKAWEVSSLYGKRYPVRIVLENIGGAMSIS